MHMPRPKARIPLLRLALAKADLVAAQLAEARIGFARDYASHKDLAAAEVRYATALDSLRSELRGMNERLDRIIDRLRSIREAATPIRRMVFSSGPIALSAL